METLITVPTNADIKETPRHFYWYSDGMLFCVAKKTLLPPMNVEETKGVLDAFAAVAPGKKICMLTDVSNATANPKQVREFISKELPKFVNALAMITTSPVGKVVGSLFLALKAQPYPAKIFSNEEDAKEWIQQYLNK